MKEVAGFMIARSFLIILLERGSTTYFTYFNQESIEQGARYLVDPPRLLPHCLLDFQLTN
jgi:hypothetical protein